jgi:hypothetical protein
MATIARKKVIALIGVVGAAILTDVLYERLRAHWEWAEIARSSQATLDSLRADTSHQRRLKLQADSARIRMDSMDVAREEYEPDFTSRNIVLVLYGDSLVREGNRQRDWRRTVLPNVRQLGWSIRSQSRIPVTVRMPGVIVGVRLPTRMPSAGALVGVRGERWIVLPIDSLLRCSRSCWEARVVPYEKPDGTT